MADYTMFTAMPINDLIILIKEAAREAVKNELAQFINSLDARPDNLINIEEAAKFLQVSKVTIHKWKKKNLIQPHRIGRKVLFKKQELLDSLNSNTLKRRKL